MIREIYTNAGGLCCADADCTAVGTSKIMGGLVKIFLIILLLFCAVDAGAAEKVFVTDKLQVNIRSGQGTDFKIVNRLSSGASMTRLENNPTTGYSKVRMKNGQVGWILTRFLSEKPVARWLLNSATEKLNRIEEENGLLKQNLEALRAESTQTEVNNKALGKRSEQLKQEVENIRKTAGSALSIQRQRDQLQERVIGLERELQKMRRDKESLEDSTSQDWFMIGAAVLFAGVVVGLILPRISWRRKTSSWDSF